MGNFYGFFIPKEVLEEVSFHKEDEFELSVGEGQITISKPGQNPSIELSEFADEELDAWSSCLEDIEDI